MTENPLVWELVQLARESNRSAEEVCSQYPELLSEVCEQLRRVRTVEAHLEDLFPSSHDEDTPGFDSLTALDGELPAIPGYELENIIGQGGMGIVFRARHIGLNRFVAIKMMLSGAFASRSERIRFIREAEAVAALSHAHIVQVHDVGESERRPYFTMELLDGSNLTQQLGGTPQPVAKSAQLVAILATAVAYAHDHGIVHRDLKPGNILFCADGTPKIADFGLAQRVDSAQDLTITGARLGTPSYMAPEQARGETRAVGPAADIYALGAILYEMLTGRPPFRAATAAETERQVIAEDPVRPSRLNVSVPRDLENICLKCLHKDPQRRYLSARELTQDLQRFLDGAPVLARPVSSAERIWKWTRRRPTSAALVVTSIALLALLIGGGFWLERQRAAEREELARQEGRASQALKGAIKSAETLQRQGHWPAARKELSEAENHIAHSEDEALIERFREARRNAEMVTLLDEIRQRVAEAKHNQSELSSPPDQMYADAFRRFGMDIASGVPDTVVDQIREHAISEILLSFLHDWLHDASDANRLKLQKSLDRVDSNDWRRMVRNALMTKDAERLRALASAPDTELQSALVISGLALALHESIPGDEVSSLLRKVQLRYSEDFWINFFLGDFLLKDHPQNAVGYLSAAVGIRPDSPAAYMLLGQALRDTGDAFGAITAFRRAVALDPSRAGSAEVARAVARTSNLRDAREVWEKALAMNPPGHDRWNGYTALCLFLGNEEAYIRGRSALLQRTISDNDPWVVAERNSLACLLRPAEGAERDAVLALVARANQMAPKYPDSANAYIQFVNGLSQYRLGEFPKAIGHLQEAAAMLPNRPGPRLALAMAEYQAGEKDRALHSMAVAVRSYNWTEQQATTITSWVNHVLRREAEELILPQQADFLKGEYAPRTNDERLALLGIAQARGKYDLAARLYADAFARDPDLADNLTFEWRLRGSGMKGATERLEPLNVESRYLAARCAALASMNSTGVGSALDSTQREGWRQQARQWLLDDMQAWQKILQNGFENDSLLTKTILMSWEVDPDLACVREEQAIEGLSAGEQQRCRDLWRQVGEMREGAGQSSTKTDSVRESRASLVEQRRLRDARDRWQMELEKDPAEPDAWNAYPELCLFLGQVDDYRRVRQALLLRFGASTDAGLAERIGRSCLLMPADGQVVALAAAAAERAYESRRAELSTLPFYAFTKSLSSFRQGHFEEAIGRIRTEAKQVYGPAPGLIVAMSLEKTGEHEQAVEALATAIIEYDWRQTHTRDPATWTFNILRREAETIVLPNAAAFMLDENQPRTNFERLALLGACQFDGRWEKAAQLFADAFAADPSLPQQLVAAGLQRFPWGQATMDPMEVLCSSSRFGAARCAALASEAEHLDESERAKWREYALQWLRNDVEVWKSMLETGSATERVIAKNLLSRCHSEADLECLRTEGVGKLPVEVANRCRELWSMVESTLRNAPPNE